MILDITIPELVDAGAAITVETVYVADGEAIAVGARLFDLSVDIGGAYAQNCPPISYYRLIAREKGWIRRLDVAEGDTRRAGDRLAVASAQADTPLSATEAKPLRLASASILSHSRMWSTKSAP